MKKWSYLAFLLSDWIPFSQKMLERASFVYPNVANLCRGKTRKSAPHVAAHRLGQVEAYFTVREVLSEASTAADGVLSREFSGFGRHRFVTLGFTLCSSPGVVAYEGTA